MPNPRDPAHLFLPCVSWFDPVQAKGESLAAQWQTRRQTAGEGEIRWETKI